MCACQVCTLSAGPGPELCCPMNRHDCSCRHVFCRFCIARFQDCPVCGSDIQQLTADDSGVQTGVDMILAHVAFGAPEMASEQVGMASNISLAGVLSGSPATDLLQLGLQSMRGGNLAAALHRYTIAAPWPCNLLADDIE